MVSNNVVLIGDEDVFLGFLLSHHLMSGLIYTNKISNHLKNIHVVELLMFKGYTNL